MSIASGVFYIFASIAILAALMVVISKNSVRSLLFLILTFVSISPLWLMLQAEFLAMTLVLVYVGAVMVLFLFVIMMLDIELEALKAGFARYLPLGSCVAVLVVLGLVYSVDADIFKQPMEPVISQGSNIQNLGLSLYTDYLLPFELSGVILLVSMIAAISLTLRGPRNRQRQNIAMQLRADKRSRLKLIAMPSEPSL